MHSELWCLYEIRERAELGTCDFLKKTFKIKIRKCPALAERVSSAGTPRCHGCWLRQIYNSPLAHRHWGSSRVFVPGKNGLHG